MEKFLTKSLETYLLAIDTLLENKQSIIVKDIAEFLQIGGASTSNAIKKLREKGYIIYEPYENITFTMKGKEVVSLKKYRHNTITKFLNRVLGIDLQSAKINAEAIEYSMTNDVLIKLVGFMDFMEHCNCSEPKWIKSCQSALKEGQISKNCQNCTGGCCCGK